jgi:hypothetical protein
MKRGNDSPLINYYQLTGNVFLRIKCLGQMRQLEKTDVIGKRIADVIVSMPDKPVTMSDQSYSPGYLQLDTGDVINLGAYAPPLVSCDEGDFCNLVRDTEYEKEFCPAIGQTIIDLAFPDDTEDGSLHVATANGFVITFAASCFWIRPFIEPVKK